MKSFDLLRTVMQEKLTVAHDDMFKQIVCGTLIRETWYIKEDAPIYGKADAVLFDGTRYVFLYLIE